MMIYTILDILSDVLNAIARTLRSSYKFYRKRREGILAIPTATILCVVLSLLTGMSVVGCSDSRRSGAIITNSSTAKETDVLALLIKQDNGRWLPYEESANTWVLRGTIASLTTGVEIYEMKVRTSEPVGELTLYSNDALIFYNVNEVGKSSPAAPTREHTIVSSNRGFLLDIYDVKDTRDIELYADISGLDGKSVTFSVTSVTVSTEDNRNRRELTVENASKTIQVAEPVQLTVQMVGPYIRSYSAHGTDDLLAEFEVTNHSTKHSVSIEGVNASSIGLALMTLADSQGNVICTATPGPWGFSLRPAGNANAVIPPGGTNRFQIRGDTTAWPSTVQEISLASVFGDSSSGMPGSAPYPGLTWLIYY